MTNAVRNIFWRLLSPVLSAPPVQTLLTKLSRSFDVTLLLLGVGAISLLWASLNLYAAAFDSTAADKMSQKLHVAQTTLHVISPDIAQTNNDTKPTEPEEAPEPQPIEYDQSLYETVDSYSIPALNDNRTKTIFSTFRKDFDPTILTPNKPTIAFAMRHYGLSQNASQLALDILPAHISLILSPYARAPQQWIDRARQKGHEVWVEIPFQSSTLTNVGASGIYHHQTLPIKMQRFYTSLSNLKGYAGVAAYTDDSMNNTKKHYNAMFRDLYTRGIGYLELNTTQDRGLIYAQSIQSGGVYIQANNTLTNALLYAEFEALEQKARDDEALFTLLDLSQDAIKKLSVWLLKAGEIDYTIIPASALKIAEQHLYATNN